MRQIVVLELVDPLQVELDVGVRTFPLEVEVALYFTYNTVVFTRYVGASAQEEEWLSGLDSN
jgi:hypothetical protein